mgnify:CR=1 FL=1
MQLHLGHPEKALGTTYPAGYQYTPADDAKRAKFMAWMIETKKPDLLTGYLASLDEAEHEHGPYEKQTFATLEQLDALVGQVRAAAERTWGRQFVLAVVSVSVRVIVPPSDVAAKPVPPF